jgi:photosystem II stability/assembly factor-like uncharacterized protein
MKKAFFLVTLLFPLFHAACTGSGAVSPITPKTSTQPDTETVTDSAVVYWSAFPVTFTLTDSLNGICLVSKKLGWACGNNGTVLKYDGETWSAVDTTYAKNENLFAVGFSDENTGWIVGSHGTVLSYKNGSWSKEESTTEENLYGLAITKSNTVWAVGANGTILTYNGVSWGKINEFIDQKGEAATIREDLNGVDMTDQNNGWACGNRGTILRYNGQKWVVYSASPSTERLNAICIVNNVQAWIVGAYGTILRFNGTVWNKEGAAFPGTDLYQVQMKNDSDGWAVGQDGTILYYDGTRWISHVKPEGKPSMNALSFYKDDGFIVGQKGTVLRFQAKGEPAKFDFLFKGLAVKKATAGDPVWSVEYTLMNKSSRIAPLVIFEVPLPRGFDPYQSKTPGTQTPTQTVPSTATPTPTATAAATGTPGTTVSGSLVAPRASKSITGEWKVKDGFLTCELGNISSSELKSLTVKLQEKPKEKKQFPVFLRAALKSGDKIIAEAAPVTLISEADSADTPGVSSPAQPADLKKMPAPFSKDAKPVSGTWKK